MFWKKSSGAGLNAEIKREMTKIQREDAKHKVAANQNQTPTELSHLKTALMNKLEIRSNPKENPCQIDGIWFGVVTERFHDEAPIEYVLCVFLPCRKCDKLRPFGPIHGNLSTAQHYELSGKFTDRGQGAERSKMERKMELQNAKRKLAEHLLSYQKGSDLYYRACPHCGIR